MKTLKAFEAEVGKQYYSPKGVPCTILEIQDNSVLVESSVTGNQLEIPKDLLLFEEYEVTPEVEEAVKLVATAKSLDQEKVVGERKKADSVSSIVEGIFLGLKAGESIKLDFILEAVHNHISGKWKDLADAKILDTIRSNILYTLKKKEIATFTFDKTQSAWTRN